MDRVILHVDVDRAGDALVNQRLAYVALSRGRYDAQVYTNDKTRLTNVLSRDVTMTIGNIRGVRVNGRPVAGPAAARPAPWHSGWAAAKQRTTALRMFLRFVIAEGRCDSGLTGAIPVLVHRRLSSLPRYLSADDVERVLASCDTASAVGRRDHAILLLLARLGLRAGDIVQLRLRDLDWRAAWIHVTGKGRRETRLPLTREVGDALVAYLTQSRPDTDTEVVFVRSRAPFRAFRSHCAVSVIVDRAFARAGGRDPPQPRRRKIILLHFQHMRNCVRRCHLQQRDAER